MRFIVEIEYEPDEEETEERTREIIKGNIENCLGKVISIRSNNTIIETPAFFTMTEREGE